MAAPLLAPNPYADTTTGVPWSPYYGGPQTTTRQVGYGQPYTTQASQSPIWAATDSGPIILPANFNQNDVAQYVQSWNQRIKTIDAAIAASEGFERDKWVAMREDATKALQNAYNIADLQSQTQRYGYDTTRQTALDDLAEKANEFGQNHNLDEAKAFASFSSSPDMMFARNDLVSALGRVGQGLGPQPVMSQGQPHANTWQDFAALQGFGNLPAVTSGQTPGAVQANGGGAALSANQGATGANGAPPPDPRLKAVNAIAQAIPPSGDPGHNDNDYAALGAIQNLYAAGQPGAVARLGAPRQKIADAGLSRLGFDAPTVELDNQRAGIGQGAARAA